MQKPPLCFGNPSPPEFTSLRRLLQDSINVLVSHRCAPRTPSMYVDRASCTTRGLKGRLRTHAHVESLRNKQLKHKQIPIPHCDREGLSRSYRWVGQAKRKHLHTKQLKIKRQDGYNRTRFTTYSTRIPRSERESEIRTTVVATRPSAVP